MWEKQWLFPFYRWESWRSKKFQRPAAQSQSAHEWCSGYWHFCFKNTVYGCQIYVITHTEINKILIKGLWGLKRFKTISVVVAVFQKHLNKICSCNYVKTSPGNLFSLISVLVTPLLTRTELGHRAAVGVIRLGNGDGWTREVTLYFVSRILQISEQSYQSDPSPTWVVENAIRVWKAVRGQG